MSNETTILNLESSDVELIKIISEWYYNEWKIPLEITKEKLSKQHSNGVRFQLVLKREEEIIATGGLYDKVSLLVMYPKFNTLNPWVALLYVHPIHRGKRYGAQLLKEIETISKKIGFHKIYLFRVY